MEQPLSALAVLARRLEAGEVVHRPDVSGLGHDTFVRETLGLRFDEFARDRIVGHLEPGPQHWQNAGIVHGGVWCAVVETLASWGAALRVATAGREVVGVSNRTEFLRPHRTGRIDAVASLVDEVGHLQWWDVVLTRARDGEPVARGSVRLQQLRARAGATAAG
ncbi:PaaI family thioesterase [Egicoccus sp. AB-alg2]|uniref:PaaI family thioesterase n=1 Tax=Egicoccus sp. AB-alg2 TaxID=3242693 RepID=UPI00359E929A